MRWVDGITDSMDISLSKFREILKEREDWCAAVHVVAKNWATAKSLQSCPTLCDPMDCSRPGFLVYHQLPELVHVHPVSDVIQPSHSLLSPSPPASIFPSIRVFPNKSVLHIRWPKYWSFSFSISPSNEYSRLISLRIDCLDLLAVQETLKSLLQYHSLKTLILQCPAFFMVQLSHLYMTTGKTIALAIGTFVGKVMYLLFNMLSRLIIVFLLRGKCL